MKILSAYQAGISRIQKYTLLSRFDVISKLGNIVWFEISSGDLRGCRSLSTQDLNNSYSSLTNSQRNIIARAIGAISMA